MNNQQYPQRPNFNRPNPPVQQQIKPPIFEVVKLTPVNTGTLKAFVDIQIGKGPNSFTVCKWRLVQQSGQEAWVSAPQESWQASDGERRYTNLFVYPREWTPHIKTVVLDAWEKAVVEGRDNEASE
jgi:hypothetical protein